MFLERGQNLAVDEHHLPQAGPDSQALVSLEGTLLGQNLIKLLEDVMLNRTGSLSGNVAQACLHGEREADKFVGRVTAPESVRLQNAEEAVELVHIGDEVVLHEVSNKRQPRKKKPTTHSWETLSIEVVGKKEALERTPKLGGVLTFNFLLDPPLQGFVAWHFIQGKVCQAEAAALMGLIMVTVSLHRHLEGRGGLVIGQIKGDVSGLASVEAWASTQHLFGDSVLRPDVLKSGLVLACGCLSATGVWEPDAYLGSFQSQAMSYRE